MKFDKKRINELSLHLILQIPQKFLQNYTVKLN